MLVKVASSFLKRAFEDLSKMNCETVCFTTDSMELIITAGDTITYENRLPIEECLEYMNTTINVQYIDISNLLGERDNVSISFTSFSLDISYKSMGISLSVSDSIVQRPTLSDSEKILISDKDSLKRALSIFKGLGIFQKTLQMERPLQLFGDYGVIQYPTCWVRVRSSGIVNVITREQADIITAFDPAYFSKDEVLTLYRDNAVLILPTNDVPEDDEFLDMVNSMESYGVKSTKGLLTRVKKLSSTLGVCDCSVYVGESTLHFAISKNTLKIVDKADENIIYSFDTRLEYVVAILSLIGSDGDMEVLANADAVCMRNSSVAVVLSTGR